MRKREKAAAPPADPQPEPAEQPPSDSGFYVMTGRTGVPTDEGLDDEDLARQEVEEAMFGGVDANGERAW